MTHEPEATDEEQADDLASLRHEYTEVMSIYRHYSTIRFAILTALLTASGLIFLRYSNVNSADANVAPVLGVLILIFFSIYHEVIVISQDSFHLRLRQLEEKIGYKSIILREDIRLDRFGDGLWRTIISFRFASRMIFLAFLTIWVISAVQTFA